MSYLKAIIPSLIVGSSIGAYLYNSQDVSKPNKIADDIVLNSGGGHSRFMIAQKQRNSSDQTEHNDSENNAKSRNVVLTKFASNQSKTKELIPFMINMEGGNQSAELTEQDLFTLSETDTERFIQTKIKILSDYVNSFIAPSTSNDIALPLEYHIYAFIINSILRPNNPSSIGVYLTKFSQTEISDDKTILSIIENYLRENQRDIFFVANSVINYFNQHKYRHADKIQGEHDICCVLLNKINELKKTPSSNEQNKYLTLFTANDETTEKLLRYESKARDQIVNKFIIDFAKRIYLEASAKSKLITKDQVETIIKDFFKDFEYKKDHNSCLKERLNAITEILSNSTSETESNITDMAAQMLITTLLSLETKWSNFAMHNIDHPRLLQKLTENFGKSVVPDISRQNFDIKKIEDFCDKMYILFIGYLNIIDDLKKEFQSVMHLKHSLMRSIQEKTFASKNKLIETCEIFDKKYQFLMESSLEEILTSMCYKILRLDCTPIRLTDSEVMTYKKAINTRLQVLLKLDNDELPKIYQKLKVSTIQEKED